MSKNEFIPLNRQFSVVPKSQQETGTPDDFSFLSQGEIIDWAQLENAYRCVILAEAGAGKTQEFIHQAHALRAQGKAAFFIRIEDIDADFGYAFEVGEEEEFDAWLDSDEEAWFFLDSIDEARLESHKAFRQALLRFKRALKKAALRAHIFLSSRPYAWRFVEDRKLLEDHFPAPSTQEASEEKLTVYSLKPLDSAQIRHFSQARNTAEIELLLNEIERLNLWNLAERPFDLDNILAKWDTSRSLDGRLQLLDFNINQRLKEQHNANQSQVLNLKKAQQGARALAAAVVLTGQPGISLPDSAAERPGIEPDQVLTDWTLQDIKALLKLGIFNDVIYQVVRFRHREIRELLAAQWLNDLLQQGSSRAAVEALIFRDSYGEQIITPRLRPLLPWLILFDDKIRLKALAISPEIAVEGGDPAQLPIAVRQRILRDIVRRIASDEDNHGARDNSAIARIAKADLTDDTLQLIQDYRDNDDAIFFLGRLVWQGRMMDCVESLLELAVNPERGLYARRASIRAVMTCGTEVQKQQLWERLNQPESALSWELLGELVREADANIDTVLLLASSLSRLTFRQYESAGFTRILQKFVGRLPVEVDQLAIIKFVGRSYQFLKEAPYIDPGVCQVSEKYAWLLNPTICALERLIAVRSPFVLERESLAILLMVPELRLRPSIDYREYQGNLREHVPAWPELNDALYWACFKEARTNYSRYSDKSFITDATVQGLGHYWQFSVESLPRLLGYMASRESSDDQRIALSTAIRVCEQENHPLSCLWAPVTGKPLLQQYLISFLYPPISDVMRRMMGKVAVRQDEYEREAAKEKKAHEQWVAALRQNPDQIRTSSQLLPDELSTDQVQLLHIAQGDETIPERSAGANWQALEVEFGNEVARAYRDAAVNFWRHFTPALRSGDADYICANWDSLTFAMGGLAIEAAECVDFPCNLSSSEVTHALRYMTEEREGFPDWFEPLSRQFPDEVTEAVKTELQWELQNMPADRPMNYILPTLVYYGKTLHDSVAPVILEWAERAWLTEQIGRYYCLCILISAGSDPEKLAAIARRHINLAGDLNDQAFWHALQVDCDPANGIPALKYWLEQQESTQAGLAAEIFILTLMIEEDFDQNIPNVGNFCTPAHLKSLFQLMRRYIPVQGDIKARPGARTPSQRQKAQYERERLLSSLGSIPGQEAWQTLNELAYEFPNDQKRFQAAAHRRAEIDGDLDLLSAGQVAEFTEKQTVTPCNHRQLFDLTVQRLQDLKAWLEEGNDSPAQTWQLAPCETEMRNLIAGWLGQNALNQYTVAQELELANGQRIDIALHTPQVPSPLPIELKLLDKGWSGNQLCDALSKQLLGDYMRERTAEHGVLLLVSQHAHEKTKQIDDCRVELAELSDALKKHWHSNVAADCPGVKAVKVIVVDLALRAQVCNTRNH